MKKATSVFYLIQGFGFMVIYDPAGRIYIKLDPYYQNKVCGLCGNNDGLPSDFIASNGIPSCKKTFIKSYVSPTCFSESFTTNTEITDTCEMGNINAKEVAKPLCQVLRDADYYGELCLGTEEAAYYHKLCMYDVCAAANSQNPNEKREALCRSAMALAHFCTQKGLDGIKLPHRLAEDVYCPGKNGDMRYYGFSKSIWQSYA